MTVLEQDYKQPMDFMDKCMVVAASLCRLHKILNFSDRKKLAQAIFKRIFVQDKKIVGVECNPPFDFLLKDGLNKVFEVCPITCSLEDVFEQMVDQMFTAQNLQSAEFIEKIFSCNKYLLSHHLSERESVAGNSPVNN